MSRFLTGLVKVLAGIMLLVLIAAAVFSPYWAARPEDVKVAAFTPIPTAIPALPETTAAPTPESTATPEPTATPTPSPTPSPTPEPTPVTYTISMVGDCTLASYLTIPYRDTLGFEAVIGEDYAYPFSNTADTFSADDLTIVNLECSISDLNAYGNNTFTFKAPSVYTRILQEGSVEAATMANNHAMDFGLDVYNDTAANLEAAGIAHCGDGEGVIYTAESGLRVGIFAAYNGHWPSAVTVAQGVKDLLSQGAEVVVVCAHWGNEASYYQNANQTEVAHAAIDAGASVVVGHGPHRLQPYEEYHGGVIFYSLGNFVFGGNTLPGDMDSIIAQVVFERSEDGSLVLKEARALPCSISSKTEVNDYRPTLFDPGTDEYSRAMSKVDGSWNGPNQHIDYSFMHPEDQG